MHRDAKQAENPVQISHGLKIISGVCHFVKNVHNIWAGALPDHKRRPFFLALFKTASSGRALNLK